jgi:hypothetical protein
MLVMVYVYSLLVVVHDASSGAAIVWYCVPVILYSRIDPQNGNRRLLLVVLVMRVVLIIFLGLGLDKGSSNQVSIIQILVIFVIKGNGSTADTDQLFGFGRCDISVVRRINHVFWFGCRR